jgi:hypothetical protein
VLVLQYLLHGELLLQLLLLLLQLLRMGFRDDLQQQNEAPVSLGEACAFKFPLHVAAAYLLPASNILMCAVAFLHA